MPKVSIITINYNDQKGLVKTIESVINQTHLDFEYIIIDGNSSDGSKEIIQKYKNKITYSISEPDSGIYNAMNKGIKVAKGDYLLFLNSGDQFIDEKVIEKIIPQLNNEISIYYGNLVYSSNGIPKMLNIPPSELSFSYFLDYSLPHPASFIKRELFFKYFTYNESLKIISDWEFFIYTICKMNEPYKHIDIVIADFDDGGISSLKENNQSLINERNQVLKSHFPLFQDEIKLIEEIKSKKFSQYKCIMDSRFRRKVLKRVVKLLLIFKTEEVSKFSEYYQKIN
ncbi:glycosyltransferase family 2 protein [Flavobacterium sp.]|uniref:glycosyltransferase family 2 protein n=1 Tax=Flavobacterium sp. TaxID=239 RepID=UPI00286CA800|nr:glycosyltransferase family 2 protein [Flavobacterium sp.]